MPVIRAKVWAERVSSGIRGAPGQPGVATSFATPYDTGEEGRMVKLIALYRKPEDPEAFDRHYEEVHAPLIRKVPGLIHLEVSRVLGAPGGRDSRYYLVADMAFKDRAEFDAAMASPEMREAGKDLASFAGDLVTMLIAAVEDGAESGGSAEGG